MRERVGLYDLSPASKFEVSGARSAEWLDAILASGLPPVGRSALCYLLTRSGGVACEFTLSRLAEDRFYLVGATVAERHHFDVLARLLPDGGSVSLRNLTSQFGVFAVAGPRAREVLSVLIDTDLGNAAFPSWSNRELTVGLASAVRALRINYVGELGWELHHPIEYQRQLFDALLAAGERCALALVGRRAVESLRLEKSYRALWRDLSTEYTALESRLDRFLDLEKPGFIGQAALLAQRRHGLKRRLTVLSLASGEADPFQNETVYREGKPVGHITSAAYGRAVGCCLAHAYVDVPHDAEGTELEVAVLGKRRAAHVIAPSPYDPTGARSRL